MRIPPIGSLFSFNQGARKSDPDTSKAAAVHAPIKRSTHRYRILEVFGDAIPVVHFGNAEDFAINASEAASRAGLPLHSCGWKRVSELKREGLISCSSIRPDPRTGLDRESYTITDAGRLALSKARGTD